MSPGDAALFSLALPWLHDIRVAFILTFDESMESHNTALMTWGFGLVGAADCAGSKSPVGSAIES